MCYLNTDDGKGEVPQIITVEEQKSGWMTKDPVDN
jgi:hypothetical protein